MLARYLSGRREAPASLRELVAPCLLAGYQRCWFSSNLTWEAPSVRRDPVRDAVLGRVKPSLLFMLASPVVSLLLAFTIWTWVTWMAILITLMIIWRPYVAEARRGGAQRGDGFRRDSHLAATRALPAESPPRSSIPRLIRRRRATTPFSRGRDRFRRLVRERVLEGPRNGSRSSAQHTDFIFSVVGEELGFLGVLPRCSCS
jgi:hypothetical protein